MRVALLKTKPQFDDPIGDKQEHFSQKNWQEKSIKIFCVSIRFI